LQLALRPTVPARERYYANPRPARRGNAPLRQRDRLRGQCSAERLTPRALPLVLGRAFRRARQVGTELDRSRPRTRSGACAHSCELVSASAPVRRPRAQAWARRRRPVSVRCRQSASMRCGSRGAPARRGVFVPTCIHAIGSRSSAFVVRRVEPGARVAGRERLQDPLDALPGRRALDQSVLGHALLGLEGRAVPPPVDVHGHAQQLPSSRHRARQPLGVEAAALVRPAVRIQACIERGACGAGNRDGDRRPGRGRNRSARSADDHLQCRLRPIVGRPPGATPTGRRNASTCPPGGPSAPGRSGKGGGDVVRA
jgi:hypothetical protein